MRQGPRAAPPDEAGSWLCHWPSPAPGASLVLTGAHRAITHAASVPGPWRVGGGEHRPPSKPYKRASPSFPSVSITTETGDEPDVQVG